MRFKITMISFFSFVFSDIAGMFRQKYYQRGRQQVLWFAAVFFIFFFILS